jgi:hypothetical protein
MRYAAAHSLSWWRPLNIAGYHASVAAGRWVSRRAEPLARFPAQAESVLRSMFTKRETFALAGWTSRDASPSSYARAWLECASEYAVRPAWAPERMEWMLAFAAKRKAFGPLRLQIAYDPAGRLAGCYAYHGGAFRRGIVISVMARKALGDGVARLLLEDASHQRCLSLQGPADPRTIEGFHGVSNVYYRKASATIISGGDDALAMRILGGDGLLGGWVGDSWTPMSTESYG